MAYICGVVGVVTDEPVEGAGELERDRRDEHQSDEDVQGDQLANLQDGDSLNEQRDQQNHPHSSGQASIAIGAFGPLFARRVFAPDSC